MSKVNNYLVTFSEVSTMGFTAKATWPVGSGSYAMNRGEVDTYWYVRQDASPYSGYTNKRYPRYQDLEATTSTSTTSTTSTTAAPVFKYSAASANDACTGGLTMTNVILDNTGLCNSTTITCDEFLYAAAAITVWISFAGDVREATINDPNTYGEATFVAACGLCSALTTTTTTTTAAPLNSITYGFDASDPDQACTNYETNVHVTKYNAGNAASANGVTIWNNSNASGTPTNGYYARGGNVWYSTSGVLGSEAVCYAGTTTTTTTTTTEAPTTTTTTTSTTTTTAAPLNPLNYGFHGADPDIACDNYDLNIHVVKYNQANSPSANGISIYNNSNGTGTPTDGYYSRGGNVWYSTSGVLSGEAVCYGGTTTTTTTTTTTSTTTTTTTTAAPTSYKYSAASAYDACTGGLTMTNILLIGGAFCSGTGIQCDEFVMEAAGINVWISDGTNVRYVVIDDPNISGTATYVGACSACSAITTTTTTTTTTTAPTYITYPADKYVCAGVNCGAFDSSVYIAFTSGFTPIVGKWYSALTPDGYAYELTSITPAVGAGLIMYESSFNTCGLACSI